MATVHDESRHGILNPSAGEEHFGLERHAPARDLEPFIERYWTVRWDLRGRAPYAQETLPYPCVNVVIGTYRPGVYGVGTRRFVAELAGAGWVFGVKFRPGGFRPFVTFPVCDLTDRSLTLDGLFGPAGATLEREVHSACDDHARIAAVEAFFRARVPRALEYAAVSDTTRAVELAREDPSLARVADLAARVGTTVRRLERLFRAYVGVPPKWVLRRFRVQDAAERARHGAALDWAALAAELGYFDQAHFIRDFKAQVGRTPAEYAAWCSSGATGGA